MNPDSIKHLRAFPGTRSSAVVPSHEGMSLRDYFAAKAMQVCLAQANSFPDEHWRDGIARDAYAMADAMLEARETP